MKCLLAVDVCGDEYCVFHQLTTDSCNKSLPDCIYNWTETRANRIAADYFGRYYGVKWESDKYDFFGLNRSIVDGYPL